MSEEVTTSTTEPTGEVKLEGKLGVPELVFMVVAGAAPLTVVVGILPLMITLGNGIGAALDFVVAGVLLLLFAVGFTTMTPEVENAGAFYTYIQKGLGKIPGLAAAGLAIVSYIMLIVAVIAYFGAAAHNALQSLFGLDAPWWIFSIVAAVIVALLGHHNVELSAKVLGVLLVAEIAIVAIVDFVIVIRGGDAGISGEPLSFGSFFNGPWATGVMLAIFGFVGFEATAVFRTEARNPERTIPRATYAAAILIAAFYAFSAYCMIIGIGAKNAVGYATKHPETFVPDIAERFVGVFAHDAIQVLLMTSFLACILTFHNVVSRYLYTLGKQGVLPRRLGTVHPQHKSPYVASFTTFVIAFVIFAIMAICRLDPVLDIYTWYGTAATLGVVILMAATSLAVLVHFRNTTRRLSLWKRFIAPALAFLGLGAVTVMVIVQFPALMGGAIVALLFEVFLLGAIVAGAWRAAHLRAKRPEVYDNLTT
jgi:amino acid transporter